MYDHNLYGNRTQESKMDRHVYPGHRYLAFTGIEILDTSVLTPDSCDEVQQSYGNYYVSAQGITNSTCSLFFTNAVVRVLCQSSRHRFDLHTWAVPPQHHSEVSARMTNHEDQPYRLGRRRQ
jgi:hypothetical protein